MNLGNLGRLAVAVLVCEAAGVVGSFFTAPAIGEWYLGIEKPWFNPPNWVFAPAWTLLFFLMGVALYIVWSRGLESKGVKTAVSVFGVQLALNVLWSIIFFGLRQPLYAFAEIILLWLAILFTIVKFYPVSRKAAFLLVPYILWVSFAAALNFFIWQMNG